MKYVAMVAIVALVAFTSADTGERVAAAGPTETVAAATPADTILMEGIELQFHESGPTFGEVRAPTFRMSASRGEWAESSQHWTLENANAVIHREGQDDLLLSAARGFCDLEREVAVLSDGVHARTGDIEVDVADLHYDNESGIARSDAHTKVTDGTNDLEGMSIEIDTRTDRVRLREGSGTIQMAAAQEPAAASGDAPADSDSRYESLDLEFKGEMKLNMETTQLEEVTKDVVLTMYGVVPADNLKVQAQKVTFMYLTKTDKKPQLIRLTGGVSLEHSAGNGRADEVVVNFITGNVEFRGNAELTGERFDAARAPVITINLFTKDAVIGPGGASVQRVRLKEDEP
ncbi:LPS export ABC transporter periplasmic protein LptC, partial [Candidatus Uhrbacteria bacterium]|nr:LPS export ABC transporter periplasmic protein LptC [Candidatus Uhrbacteria bacterium]